MERQERITQLKLALRDVSLQLEHNKGGHVKDASWIGIETQSAETIKPALEFLICWLERKKDEERYLREET